MRKKVGAVIMKQWEFGMLHVTYLERLLIEIRVNITTVLCTMCWCSDYVIGR